MQSELVIFNEKKKYYNIFLKQQHILSLWVSVRIELANRVVLRLLQIFSDILVLYVSV